MSLYFSSLYKNRIINLLLKNKDFITLLSPTPSACEDLDIIDVLLGGKWVINGIKHEEQGYIFDYNFANETTKEEKTFVFVETDIPSVTDNFFMDFNLYIHVFCDKNLIRLSSDTSPTVDQIKNMGYFASIYANRIDVLCDVIDQTINGNDTIPGLGTIKPASRNFVSIYYPNNNYYGKCLKYHITNINDIEVDSCGH